MYGPSLLSFLQETLREWPLLPALSAALPSKLLTKRQLHLIVAAVSPKEGEGGEGDTAISGIPFHFLWKGRGERDITTWHRSHLEAQDVCAVQGSAKRWSPGCVNAASKPGRIHMHQQQ